MLQLVLQTINNLLSLSYNIIFEIVYFYIILIYIKFSLDIQWLFNISTLYNFLYIFFVANNKCKKCYLNIESL